MDIHLNGCFLVRLIFSIEQLDFACRGLRMNDKAQKIAHEYFVLGNHKKQIADHYDVSVSYVSALISKIEANLRVVLDKNGMEIVVYFQPKNTGIN